MNSKSIDLKDFLAGSTHTRNHFRIAIDGKAFAFAYIRKCACSSLKDLVKAVHPDRDNFFEFMRSNRFSPSEDRVDYTVFFYRCAIQRVTSCAINKFIVRSGSDDIIASVEEVLGKGIDEASFADICFKYLPLVNKSPEAVDPHFWPISEQLMPIQYTHAVALQGIYPAMRELLGAPLAEKVFRTPANQTKTNGSLRFNSEQDNSGVSFSELRRIFPEYDLCSFKDSLVGPEIREQILRIYSRDQRLVSLIEEA